MTTGVWGANSNKMCLARAHRYSDFSLWEQYMRILFVDCFALLKFDFRLTFSWPELPTKYTVNLAISIGLVALQALLYLVSMYYRTHRRKWATRGANSEEWDVRLGR